MATDYYLKLDGITGESTDAAHKGEIEIESFSVGASQAAMVATSGVGGSTGARVDLSEFSVTKVLDSSSPTLFKFCATGKHIATATISVAGANESKAVYLQYVLTDVVIGSISTSGGGGGVRPQESVSLRYGKVQITYTPYDNAGKAGSAVKAGWDAMTNAAL